MPVTAPSSAATNIGFQRAEIGPAGRGALSVDDLLHLLERRAAFEQFAGARVARAAAQIRIVFEDMRREPQRLFPEIGRRVWDRWPAPP